jgi:IS30 family transposase
MKIRESLIVFYRFFEYTLSPQNLHRLDMITLLLRRVHKKRRNKGIGRNVRKTKIPNRIAIDARPKSIEKPNRFGHWEGGSMVSRKSKVALNTLTERKSPLVLISRVP